MRGRTPGWSKGGDLPSLFSCCVVIKAGLWTKVEKRGRREGGSFLLIAFFFFRACLVYGEPSRGEEEEEADGKNRRRRAKAWSVERGLSASTSKPPTALACS